MTFKQILEEKYKLVQEAAFEWPESLHSFRFTGEVSPDGESGKYKKKKSNSIRWYNKQMQWHNNFGPAIDQANGDKMWIVNGKLHRLDGPAVEYNDGNKQWFIDGIEYSKEDFDKKIKEMKTLQQAGEPYGVDLGDLEESKTEKWIRNKESRDFKFTGNITPDGESAEFIDKFNYLHWFNKRGAYHNEFGPAFDSSRFAFWRVNGEPHRLDGPATLDKSIPSNSEYWINGERLSKEEFDKKIREIKGLQQAGEPYGVDLGDLEESKEEWPVMMHSLHFTGEVSPDGESGKYFTGKISPDGESGNYDFHWYNKQGKLHNNFGPAGIYPASRGGLVKIWKRNGKYHRLDGPAIEWPDGSKQWFIDDVEYSKEQIDKKIKEIKALQQAGEPYGVDLGDLEESKAVTWRPSIEGGTLKFTGNITPDGESGEYTDKFKNKFWLNKKREYHNNFGPSFQNDNVKRWYINGVLHRLDGPAVEYSWAKEPSSDFEYWINGKEYTKEEYERKMKEMKALKQAGEPYGVDLGDL